eukprot:2894657-Rhodomonas_salina.5
MSGADIGYAATGSSLGNAARPGLILPAYARAMLCPVLTLWSVLRSVRHRARFAMRCAVLTWRMVLPGRVSHGAGRRGCGGEVRYLPTQCLVLKERMVLSAYAPAIMVACGQPERVLREPRARRQEEQEREKGKRLAAELEVSVAISLHVCYAMPDTHLAYDVVGLYACYTMPCTDLVVVFSVRAASERDRGGGLAERAGAKVRLLIFLCTR